MLCNYLKTLLSTKIGKPNFPLKNTAKRLYGYLIYLLKNDPANIVISTSYRLLTTANRTTVRRFRFKTIGDKMSWDTLPKTGLFYILLSSKGEHIAFLPHPLLAMLCPCSSYLQKTTNNPTLTGGDRGGVQILLFSKVTLFEYNVSTILPPIVV